MTDKLRDTDGDGVVRKGLLSVRTTLNDNGGCVVAAKANPTSPRAHFSKRSSRRPRRLAHARLSSTSAS